MFEEKKPSEHDKLLDRKRLLSVFDGEDGRDAATKFARRTESVEVLKNTINALENGLSNSFNQIHDSTVSETTSTGHGPQNESIFKTFSYFRENNSFNGDHAGMKSSLSSSNSSAQVISSHSNGLASCFSSVTKEFSENSQDSSHIIHNENCVQSNLPVRKSNFGPLDLGHVTFTNDSILNLSKVCSSIYSKPQFGECNGFGNPLCEKIAKRFEDPTILESDGSQPPFAHSKCIENNSCFVLDINSDSNKNRSQINQSTCSENDERINNAVGYPGSSKPFSPKTVRGKNHNHLHQVMFNSLSGMKPNGENASAHEARTEGGSRKTETSVFSESEYSSISESDESSTDSDCDSICSVELIAILQENTGSKSEIQDALPLSDEAVRLLSQVAELTIRLKKQLEKKKKEIAWDWRNEPQNKQIPFCMRKTAQDFRYEKKHNLRTWVPREIEIPGPLVPEPDAETIQLNELRALNLLELMNRLQIVRPDAVQDPSTCNPEASLNHIADQSQKHLFSIGKPVERSRSRHNRKSISKENRSEKKMITAKNVLNCSQDFKEIDARNKLKNQNIKRNCLENSSCDLISKSNHSSRNFKEVESKDLKPETKKFGKSVKKITIRESQGNAKSGSEPIANGSPNRRKTENKSNIIDSSRDVMSSGKPSTVELERDSTAKESSIINKYSQDVGLNSLLISEKNTLVTSKCLIKLGNDSTVKKSKSCVKSQNKHSVTSSVINSKSESIPSNSIPLERVRSSNESNSDNLIEGLKSGAPQNTTKCSNIAVSNNESSIIKPLKEKKCESECTLRSKIYMKSRKELNMIKPPVKVKSENKSETNNLTVNVKVGKYSDLNSIVLNTDLELKPKKDMLIKSEKVNNVKINEAFKPSNVGKKESNEFTVGKSAVRKLTTSKSTINEVLTGQQVSKKCSKNVSPKIGKSENDLSIRKLEKDVPTDRPINSSNLSKHGKPEDEFLVEELKKGVKINDKPANNKISVIKNSKSSPISKRATHEVYLDTECPDEQFLKDTEPGKELSMKKNSKNCKSEDKLIIDKLSKNCKSEDKLIGAKPSKDCESEYKIISVSSKNGEVDYKRIRDKYSKNCESEDKIIKSEARKNCESEDKPIKNEPSKDTEPENKHILHKLSTNSVSERKLIRGSSSKNSKSKDKLIRDKSSEESEIEDKIIKDKAIKNSESEDKSIRDKSSRNSELEYKLLRDKPNEIIGLSLTNSSNKSLDEHLDRLISNKPVENVEESNNVAIEDIQAVRKPVIEIVKKFVAQASKNDGSLNNHLSTKNAESMSAVKDLETTFRVENNIPENPSLTAFNLENDSSSNTSVTQVKHIENLDPDKRIKATDSSKKPSPNKAEEILNAREKGTVSVQKVDFESHNELPASDTLNNSSITNISHNSKPVEDTENKNEHAVSKTVKSEKLESVLITKQNEEMVAPEISDTIDNCEIERKLERKTGVSISSVSISSEKNNTTNEFQEGPKLGEDSTVSKHLSVVKTENKLSAEKPSENIKPPNNLPPNKSLKSRQFSTKSSPSLFNLDEKDKHRTKNINVRYERKVEEPVKKVSSKYEPRRRTFSKIDETKMRPFLREPYEKYRSYRYSSPIRRDSRDRGRPEIRRRRDTYERDTRFKSKHNVRKFEVLDKSSMRSYSNQFTEKSKPRSKDAEKKPKNYHVHKNTHISSNHLLDSPKNDNLGNVNSKDLKSKNKDSSTINIKENIEIGKNEPTKECKFEGESEQKNNITEPKYALTHKFNINTRASYLFNQPKNPVDKQKSTGKPAVRKKHPPPKKITAQTVSSQKRIERIITYSDDHTSVKRRLGSRQRLGKFTNRTSTLPQFSYPYFQPNFGATCQPPPLCEETNYENSQSNYGFSQLNCRPKNLDFEPTQPVHRFREDTYPYEKSAYEWEQLNYIYNRSNYESSLPTYELHQRNCESAQPVPSSSFFNINLAHHESRSNQPYYMNMQGQSVCNNVPPRPPDSWSHQEVYDQCRDAIYRR